MSRILFIAVIICYLQLINGFTYNKTCSELQLLDRNVQQNFNISQFQGHWIEEQRVISDGDLDASCISVDVNLLGTNKEKSENVIGLKLSYRKNENKGLGKLETANSNVTMKTLGVFEREKQQILILKTNYTDFVVAATCNGDFKTSNVSAWVLVRKVPLDKKVQDDLNDYLKTVSFKDELKHVENDEKKCKSGSSTISPILGLILAIMGAIKLIR